MDQPTRTCSVDGCPKKVHAPYSLDISRYIPLCRKCHKRFDLDWLASQSCDAG